MHRNDIEIELSAFNKKENEKSIANNQKLMLGVSFIDSLDLAAIYTLFLKEFLHKFLEETGKYILFPITLAASIIQAVLAWRQAYLDGGKSRSVVHATVETIAATAITIAAVGSLVATATFAVVTPAMFIATTAAKTLYHAASVGYYLGKASIKPDKKEKYHALAKGNAIATIVGIVATGVISSVFLFGKVALAGLGVAVGIFSAGYALYKGFTMPAIKQPSPVQLNQPVEETDSDHTENVNRKKQTKPLISRLNSPSNSPEFKRKSSNTLGIVEGLGLSPETLRRTTQSPPTAPLAVRQSETTTLLADYLPTNENENLRKRNTW